MYYKLPGNYTDDNAPCNLGSDPNMLLGDFKKLLLEKLRENFCLEWNVCADLHTSHLSFVKICNNDPEFKAAVDDIKQLVVNDVELKMLRLILNGNEKMIKFFLERRGGYEAKLNFNITTDHDGFKLKFGDNEEDD